MSYTEQKKRARLHALNNCHHDLVIGEKAVTAKTLLMVTKKLKEEFDGGVYQNIINAYAPGNVIVKCPSLKFKP